jgi:hypothetical protein
MIKHSKIPIPEPAHVARLVDNKYSYNAGIHLIGLNKSQSSNLSAFISNLKLNHFAGNHWERFFSGKPHIQSYRFNESLRSFELNILALNEQQAEALLQTVMSEFRHFLDIKYSNEIFKINKNIERSTSAMKEIEMEQKQAKDAIQALKSNPFFVSKWSDLQIAKLGISLSENTLKFKKKSIQNLNIKPISTTVRDREFPNRFLILCVLTSLSVLLYISFSFSSFVHKLYPSFPQIKV